MPFTDRVALAAGLAALLLSWLERPAAADPAGACCFNDGRCETLSAGACDAAPGIYQGDASTCNPAPCVRPVGATASWIGGGGLGDPIAATGVWDFDSLSPQQREVSASCENTVFRPFGEEVEDFGWSPSYDSNVRGRIERLQPDKNLPAPREVGGGVLSFYDDTTGNICANQRTYLESPPFKLGLGEGDAIGWDLVLRTWSDRTFRPSELVLVMGARSMVNGSWTSWVDHDRAIESGERLHRQPLCIAPGTAQVQVRIGVENRGNQAVLDRGPVADGIFFTWKKPLDRIIWKWVPDISQDGQPICQATAFANCLSYWSQNGYPELAPPNGTPEEKNREVQRELKGYVHDEGWGDGGATKYLKKRGVYRGQAQAGGRRALDHRALWKDKASWYDLRSEFEQCHDVLLRLVWYDAQGNVMKDKDGNIPAHYVTVAGLEDEGPSGKRSIRVANPWGESHHEPGVFTQDDDYDMLEIEVGDNGRIIVHNDDLEHNAASIQGSADHLGVDVINVIAPAAGGSRAPEVHFEARSSEKDGAGRATFGYAPVNLAAAPVDRFAIMVEVPYAEVESPPGWSWQRLPADLTDPADCGRRLGPSGILWSTTENPVPPGGSLGGFRFQADEGYAVEENGLIGYVQSGEFEGRWLLASGPVPSDLAPPLPVPSRRFYSAPNPARSSVEFRYPEDEQGPVRLELFDASGRLVRTLRSDIGGARTVVWDGTDEQGRPVSTGIYACRSESGSGTARRLVVLVR